ncbi:RNA-binding protein [Candidatus Uhrbacteria bacterium RIFCSPHIGHO2_12_FULL_47_12]|uniref:RNA-binding protein n=1 Tax=Candidatus Uhrbacteria bacterium RIFCSPLOWO2_02_FULL_48_18 TaxID=1802408 RepID=A0A1F7V999_9BACT|nr:MAG: RNA-binding protein [Candidatus Uhrbacteria bacterium RIFCSPHIGHO2_12_FULL_47_12]OGL81858.1 MAG: RNA-binding protein [Candidatus Uhrbacteria bacterium RIFCSPLOWO2_01_FULL_47_17]OGL87021.1 MAG: RNA-binding protein [Candidatus Uhrbacteria bacterium RIFCSPLOWO2_02_FULL_48_18]OGL91685.1 MAG: RNA-binding protein [Candidatus Uhrbacteria bacterium RIFCSPLOWO2_12_FULL_47_9]
MNNKLFVGSIPWKTTEDDLRAAFGEFGTVVSARIITDKFTGKSRGFGFVEMSSDEEALAVIAGLDGKDFQGRPIAISIARPMENKAA